MNAILPFLTSLLAGLVSQTVITAFLKRAAVALGLSAVTYFGIHAAFNSIISAVQSNYGGVPASALVVLNMMHIPQFFSVVLSSYAGALTLRGLTNLGAVTKVGVSTPGEVFSPGTF